MISLARTFIGIILCFIYGQSLVFAGENKPLLQKESAQDKVSYTGENHDFDENLELDASQNNEEKNLTRCFLCEGSLHKNKNPSAKTCEGTRGFCDQCFNEIFESSIDSQLDEGKLDAAMDLVLKNIKNYQVLYTNLFEIITHLDMDAETLDKNQFAKNIADATSDSLGILGSIAGIAGGIVLMTVPGGQVAAPFGIASGIASASSLILKGSSSAIINKLNRVESKQYEWLIIATKSVETKVYDQLLNIDKWLAYQKLKKWDGNSEFCYTSVFGQILSPQMEEHAEKTIPMIISGVVKLGDAVFNWRSMKTAASGVSEVVEQLTPASASSVATAATVADDAAAAVVTQLGSSADESSKVLTNSSSIASGAANSANMVVSNYQWLLGGFGCLASVVGLVSYSKNLYRSGSNVISSKKSDAAENLRNYSQTIAKLRDPQFFYEKYVSIQSRAKQTVL